jgi:hypothetical protein
MQRIIDEIVEQYFAGEEGMTRSVALYTENMSAFEEAATEFEYTGQVIPHDLLEVDRDEQYTLEKILTPERFDAVEDGVEPTEQEKQAYRAAVIESVQEGNADADVIPGYWVQRLRHSDGREVFALTTATGYSFSGVTNGFHGFFPSVEAALKDLSEWGLVLSN